MSDSSDIDAAVLAKLAGDTGAGGLMTLMTDGVWWDEAPPDKTKFVVVSLSANEDHHDMRVGRAIEMGTYMVKAVSRDTAGTAVKAAAARIDTLLEGTTLTVTGYTFMTMKRAERIRYTEVDENTDLRWQHRGGLYELWVSA